MKNNKLDPDAAVALWLKNHPETNEGAAREVAAQCVDVTDGDRCEAAYNIFHCLHDAAVAKGLKDPDN